MQSHQLSEQRDPNLSGYRNMSSLGDIAEEENDGVTLSMYPSLRAKMYNNALASKNKIDYQNFMMLKGK